MPTETEDIKFKIFTINNFDLSSLTNEDKEILTDGIIYFSEDKNWLNDENGRKFSLIKCTSLLKNYIFGWISQEHVLEQHLYDDTKKKTDNLVESFEDRFFVISIKNNLVALEWKKFILKPPLSHDLLIERMNNILSLILNKNNLCEKVELLPMPTITTRKEEFINIFYDNIITQVVVEDFGTSTIPEDTILINPTPGLEGALREIISHDVLHPSLARLTAETKKNSPGDLRKSAYVRGAIHSGNPVLVEYKDRQNQLKVRKKTEKGELNVSMPVFENDSAEARTSMALAVVNAIEGRDFSNITTNQKPHHQVSLLDFGGKYDG